MHTQLKDTSNLLCSGGNRSYIPSSYPLGRYHVYCAIINRRWYSDNRQQLGRTKIFKNQRQKHLENAGTVKSEVPVNIKEVEISIQQNLMTCKYWPELMDRKCWLGSVADSYEK